MYLGTVVYNNPLDGDSTRIIPALPWDGEEAQHNVTMKMLEQLALRILLLVVHNLCLAIHVEVAIF